MLTDFFSKTEGQIRAEQALIDAEDRLVEFHPDEATDLSFHAHRDADRTKVLVARQRLTTELVKRASTRNTMVTIIVGIILLMKGVNIPLISDAFALVVGK
jgi:hypothetical protein